MGIESSN